MSFLKYRVFWFLFFNMIVLPCPGCIKGYAPHKNLVVYWLLLFVWREFLYLSNMYTVSNDYLTVTSEIDVYVYSRRGAENAENSNKVMLPGKY